MRSALTRVVGMVVGLGGLLVLGGATTMTPAATALQLHPNHFAAKPPGGGGGGSGSTVGWASSNWSGYAATNNAPYHSITAQWIVPSLVATPGSSYSAAWAGIDGFTNSSLIQTGTEQDYYSGAAHYAAWWTTSSNKFIEQVISPGPGCSGAGTCGLVAANDIMNATITQVSGTSWTSTLNDTTEGWSFTKALTYSGPGASAEWIMEAPTIGGRVGTIASYTSPMTFDPGSVNGGNSLKLVASEGGELIQQRTVVSVPSTPDSDSDGFNMAHGSTPPSPPSS